MDSQTRDYYEILQVSRHAHPIVVAKAFRLLAAFYHPDNKETGSEQMLRELVEAYRTLSDPLRRAAYDRATFGTATAVNDQRATLHAVGEGEPMDECEIRRLILDTLYNVRRTRPHQPAVPIAALAELLGKTMDDLQFSFWYLRGKKWIEMPDGSEITITVAGVDEVEEPGSESERAARGGGRSEFALPAGRNGSEGPNGSSRERPRRAFAPRHERASVMLPA